MSDRLQVITRGTDSSGRTLRGTRQMFELTDRTNAAVGGKLVVVQGPFNAGVSASAGTHDAAGAIDYRTWNLTSDEQHRAGRFQRDHGAGFYLRTAAEGFDPHAHSILLSDAPMHPATTDQRGDYIAGRNALASNGPDTFGYRPSPLVHVYDYQGEDDVALTDTEKDRLETAAKAATRADEKGARIEALLKRYIPAEAQRDVDERERDRALAEQTSKVLAGLADRVGEVARDLGRGLEKVSADERVTRQQSAKRLARMKADILTQLRDDPATDNTRDNPSDKGLTDADEAAR